MALTDSLRILITANGAQAEREFSKVGATARRTLGQAESSTQRWGRSLTSAGVAMAAFGGVALAGLYKAAQAAQEEDLAIAKLNNTIANSPELAGASADAFLEQAAALQDTTTFADDATIAAQAMLGTFHLTQDEIMGLTPLVADLAAKFDIDLVDAAKQVGKAMSGNVGALQRNGVMIDEAAFATDRYSAVMTALRENAGGFAAEEGATFNGQLQIMKNNLGDVAEGLGRGAVSAFNDLLGPVTALSDKFQELNPQTQATIGRFATFGAAGLTAAGGMSFLAGQVLSGIDRFKQLRAAVSFTNVALGGVVIAAGALGFELARLTSNQDRTTDAIEMFGDAADVTSERLQEIIRNMMVMDHFGDSIDFEDLFSSLIAQGPAGVRIVQDMADQFLAAGFHVDEVREALWDTRGAAFEASGGMEELERSTRGAGDAAGHLGREWNGLSDRLSDFNAALDAQQALFGLQDALTGAKEDGQITAQEMLDLNQSLAGLVQSYADVAEANNSSGDAAANFRGRNRELRASLGALAAFIPAELRPQFNGLTRDILNVPTRHDTQMHLTGTADVSSILGSLAQLEGRIRDVAVAYTQVDRNRAAALAPNGAAAQNESTPGGVGGVVPITEAGMERAFGRALDRAVQKTILVGEM